MLDNKITLAASALLLSMSSSSFAATEIMEDGLGYDSAPTYGSMMVDTAIGRPLQGIFAAAGAATWVATLPLTLVSNSHEEAGKTLVTGPLEAFLYRCLGCTPKQDAVRRTYSYNPNRNYAYERDVYINHSEGQYSNYSTQPVSAPVVVHPYQP